MYEDDKNGQQSTGSTSYGQWNANTSQSTNNGPYSNYNSSYNNSYSNNYSYGQSSYNYNQNGHPTYGTYQYNANSQPPVTPPANGGKKKHTAAKVIAAVCILALIVGGVGFAYTQVADRFGLPVPGKEALVENTEEEVQEDVASAKQEESETDKTSESSDSDSSISTTTVSETSLGVVTDVTAVVEEVMPAMVMIHNNYTASASYFGYVQTEEATASGSGFIVGENDTELLIATNYHVIEGADSLEVIFADDSTVEAVVKGTDSDKDLAVIAVMLEDISSDTKDTIKIATLGDSNSLKLGEPAIAIGNALGYGQSVTTGVISAVNREIEVEEGVTGTFIQTDAAINPGNSGGALINLKGEVIGINSNKLGGQYVDDMGYAIPISDAQPIIDKLMNEETKIKVSDEDRGYIGISGVSVTAEVEAAYGIPRGVYVAEVSRDGGAEAAGIEKGDVITEFDGEEITSMDDLQTRLQFYAAGTTVSIKVMRQNGVEYVEEQYDVTLGHAASTHGGQDSNAGEEGETSDQYDGSTHQYPAMPGGKNGQNGQGGSNSNGG